MLIFLRSSEPSFLKIQEKFFESLFCVFDANEVLRDMAPNSSNLRIDATLSQMVVIMLFYPDFVVSVA